MRLVVSGEPLTGQLTGLGQYTYHLTKEFIEREVELKLLVHGRLIDPHGILSSIEGRLFEENASSTTNYALDGLGRLRAILASNRFVIGAYSLIIPYVEARALRDYDATDVFFSTNYMLPPFPGKRVVCIPDLSTYEYPQFHPASRVSFVNDHIERAIQSAEQIITISEFVKRGIVDRFQIDSARVSVTPLAADSTFRPMDESEWVRVMADDSLGYGEYFLSLSTFEPRKNLSGLLDAYLQYREDSGTSAIPLVLVGSRGWKSDGIRQRVRQLQEQGVLEWHGYYPQHKLPSLLAGARALLFPSQYEGFGLPALEAMQSGTPVVTTAGSAMEEVCGDAALYFEFSDTGTLTELISIVANDDSLYNRCVARGTRMAQKYSWKKCATATMNVIEQIPYLP